MYGRPNRRPVDGHVDEFRCVESGGGYPALTFSGNGFSRAEATIVTYGGMLPVALEAARELILEHEVFTEVVALGQLLPLDLEPVLESVGRTGSLVTVEEGTLTAGVGAEIAARVQAEAWDDLRAPVRRVAAQDGIVPAARELEDEMLPDVRRRRGGGRRPRRGQGLGDADPARDRPHARRREQRVGAPRRVARRRPGGGAQGPARLRRRDLEGLGGDRGGGRRDARPARARRRRGRARDDDRPRRAGRRRARAGGGAAAGRDARPPSRSSPRSATSLARRPSWPPGTGSTSSRSTRPASSPPRTSRR